MTGNVNYCVTVPTPESEDDSDDNLPNLNIKSTAPGEIKQYVTRLPGYQVTRFRGGGIKPADRMGKQEKRGAEGSMCIMYSIMTL